MRWLLLSSLLACTASDGYSEPGPRPAIVSVVGPKEAVVTCDPSVSGGACGLPISVTFRLPEDQFVWKAYVRFQGDGGDNGVDRSYVFDRQFGKGASVDATVTVNAEVPGSILRRGALFTYSVRILTGAGEESAESTLTVSVQ